MTYKLTLSIVNYSKNNLLIIIEPWSEFYTLEPEQHLNIIGEGGKEGSNFEIEYSDKYISIHAWSGCIANVYQDGIELEPEEQVVPD